MTPAAAVEIVGMLASRLEKEPTGWRDMKALVVLVASNGPWAQAAQLADALGIHPDDQELIYYQSSPEAKQ